MTQLSKRIMMLFIASLFLTFPLQAEDNNVYYQGGIIRTDPNQKQITLVFTAADKCDGAEPIMKTLRKNHVQGAFFLTGHFFHRFPDVVKKLVDKGHYVGSHSYGHLLYFPWGQPDTMSVTRDEFIADMEKSYEELGKYGITKQSNPYFIPPYEHYNQTVSDWAKEMGLQIINYTPGTASAADYTTPSMKNYRSSDSIYNTIIDKEEKDGLNGFLLIFHMGTVPERTDKFYAKHLPKLIKDLRKRGYKFTPLKEAIEK